MNIDEFEIGEIYQCTEKVNPSFDKFIFLGQDLRIKYMFEILNVKIYFIEKNKICYVSDRSHYLVHAQKIK